jgi:hypothetical protein
LGDAGNNPNITTAFAAGLYINRKKKGPPAPFPHLY